MKQDASSGSGSGSSREVGNKAVDTEVSEISAQLRSNLATIRSFMHFLEIGQYKATEQELREMHQKLDEHLELTQAKLINKLKLLAENIKANALKN